MKCRVTATASALMVPVVGGEAAPSCDPANVEQMDTDAKRNRHTLTEDGMSMLLPGH